MTDNNLAPVQGANVLFEAVATNGGEKIIGSSMGYTTNALGQVSYTMSASDLNTNYIRLGYYVFTAGAYMPTGGRILRSWSFPAGWGSTPI